MDVPNSKILNLFFAGGAKVKEEPEKEDLSDDQGSKYLGFFSSRSIKTREKCNSFAQLVLLSL